MGFGNNILVLQWKFVRRLMWNFENEYLQKKWHFEMSFDPMPGLQDQVISIGI
jgi:hypothetical protein